jgi:DNA polymerase-3 subunit chi
MVSQQPSAGEAVKAGEAAREAGRLYSFARRWQRDFCSSRSGDVFKLQERDRPYVSSQASPLMTEIRFYHLQGRKPEEALPALLEEALAEGLRAVVEALASEWIEALDERLWTYADESFLPHGSARDGEPETQPIFLTTGDDNPNGARLRVLLAGARAAPILEREPEAYQRIVILFDGADEEARAGARAQWAELKAAGHTPTYWREGETGAWEQGR